MIVDHLDRIAATGCVIASPALTGGIGPEGIHGRAGGTPGHLIAIITAAIAGRADRSGAG